MKKSELLFHLGDLVEKQAEIITSLTNELTELKKEFSNFKEVTNNRLEFLDIENQTLSKVVEGRFKKIAEAFTSQLNIATNKMEARK